MTCLSETRLFERLEVKKPVSRDAQRSAGRRRAPLRVAANLTESGSALTRRICRTIVWVMLAAGLVFCHGCHSDEDTELCAPPAPRVHMTGERAGDESGSMKFNDNIALQCRSFRQP
jgi:hypothetical protein